MAKYYMNPESWLVPCLKMIFIGSFNEWFADRGVGVRI
jgi:hypothetical protein